MIRTIENIDFSEKKVIIRCDLNVPIKDGKIVDDNRIIQSLDTIKYVLKTAKKVIILSHLGRIKTKKDIKVNTLKPVCDRLSDLLNEKIEFCLYDEDIKDKVDSNRIVMFENTRFFDIDNKKESNNDTELGKFFASFADIFINDAFGTCHRSNASNVGISNYLPTYLGFLVEKEINMLNKVKENPTRPFIVIMGGAKINDKIPLIKNIINKVDKLIISGAMACTFLKVKNYEIGKSLLDSESIDFCTEIINNFSDKIVLPIDFYTGLEFSNDTKKNLKEIGNIDSSEMILDIGPKTIELYKEILKDSKTVFVNGPMGAFEFENYSYGTKNTFDILEKINAEVIIGGGDSASACKKFGYNFTHISTGGGASLEYIEGKKLPGIIIGEEYEEI